MRLPLQAATAMRRKVVVWVDILRFGLEASYHGQAAHGGQAAHISAATRSTR